MLIFFSYSDPTIIQKLLLRVDIDVNMQIGQNNECVIHEMYLRFNEAINFIPCFKAIIQHESCNINADSGQGTLLFLSILHHSQKNDVHAQILQMLLGHPRIDLNRCFKGISPINVV